jgi:hypothetical protein
LGSASNYVHLLNFHDMGHTQTLLLATDLGLAGMLRIIARELTAVPDQLGNSFKFCPPAQFS